MNEFTVTFVIVTVTIFLLTVVAERILIPILRSRKLGQKILDIGPRWHKSKEGTPIMGGIGFILASMLVMAVFFIIRGINGTATSLIPLAMTLAFAVGNGMIGFVDDYCKLVKKQNEGLTRLQKLFLQLAFSTAYVCVMSYTGCMDTTVALPFVDGVFELGWGYYPIAVIVLTGVVNGGNITDGIDGLASSVTCAIGVFYGIVAFWETDESLSMVSAILIGATLGFLIYNFHPARVFMGDTGSLFLGALAISAAFGFGNGTLGLIVCAVFVLEMLSSFLQIFYFKITKGKRLFKMAPFHHHLEQCGWSENQIVVVFTLVEIAFCVLSWFAFF
ncbi:MAG: phospho-N-acetylmuramoyl-pentapeptide-transferase [Clostridia bacterium]|nr:phospho-N-acetylmuramoyl-pentapeptide-transferase [Clostridia bacterium]